MRGSHEAHCNSLKTVGEMVRAQRKYPVSANIAPESVIYTYEDRVYPHTTLVADLTANKYNPIYVEFPVAHVVMRLDCEPVRLINVTAYTHERIKRFMIIAANRWRDFNPTLWVDGVQLVDPDSRISDYPTLMAGGIIEGRPADQ
jgi:hypothetical protein